MAIKFSTKNQPAAPVATAKPAKPVAAPKAGEVAEAATDLFKSPVDAPKGKTAKKK
jgi:glycine cleavage system H lipoate-binding protein